MKRECEQETRRRHMRRVAMPCILFRVAGEDIRSRGDKRQSASFFSAERQGARLPRRGEDRPDDDKKKNRASDAFSSNRNNSPNHHSSFAKRFKVDGVEFGFHELELPSEVSSALFAASPISIIEDGPSFRENDLRVMEEVRKNAELAERCLTSAAASGLAQREVDLKSIKFKWTKEDFESQRTLLHRLECYEEALEQLQLWRSTALTKRRTTIVDQDELNSLQRRRDHQQREKKHVDVFTLSSTSSKDVAPGLAGGRVAQPPTERSSRLLYKFSGMSSSLGGGTSGVGEALAVNIGDIVLFRASDIRRQPGEHHRHAATGSTTSERTPWEAGVVLQIRTGGPDGGSLIVQSRVEATTTKHSDGNGNAEHRLGLDSFSDERPHSPSPRSSPYRAVMMDLVLAHSTTSYTRLHAAIKRGMLMDEVLSAIPLVTVPWGTLSWCKASSSDHEESADAHCNAQGDSRGSAKRRYALNERQLDFMRAVVGPRGPSQVYLPVHILHGPPGTGKTRTMAETIARLVVEHPNARVIVCEPTNAAMTAMLDALHATGVFHCANIRFDRQGVEEQQPRATRPTVPLLCLVASNKSVAAAHPTTRLYAHPFIVRDRFTLPSRGSERLGALRSSRVVVCTLGTAGELAREDESSPQHHRRHDRHQKHHHGHQGRDGSQNESGSSIRGEQRDCLQGIFTHVAIDEAGFVTESQWMQAARFLNWRQIAMRASIKANFTLSNSDQYYGNSSDVKKDTPTVIMMAGDHKQLAPVICLSRAGVGVERRRIITTPLERLIAESEAAGASQEGELDDLQLGHDDLWSQLLADAIVRLEINYRSHPDIIKVFSSVFYDGRVVSSRTLLSGPPRAYLQPPTVPVTAKQAVALTAATIWLDVPFGIVERSRGTKSCRNMDEVYAVRDLVNALEAAGYSRTDIGVVTPYSLQKFAIMDALDRADAVVSATDSNEPSHKQGRRARVEVDSVERFQGREKKVIIISTVRSRNTHRPQQQSLSARGDSSSPSQLHEGLGFLDCPKRTNVSISRAVERQIIVGHADFLAEKSKPWHAVVALHRQEKALMALCRPQQPPPPALPRASPPAPPLASRSTPPSPPAGSRWGHV